MGQGITALTTKENEILGRLSKGLELIGNKIVAMNSVWLNEEETIAISKNEFVDVQRDELQGDFFLAVNVKSISEAEAKAQQLTFVAQTLGAEADWGLRKIFITEICRLYNLDSMLTAIEQYQPQPDENAIKLQQLQMQELQSKIDKNTAEAEYYRSRGNFVEAQVDDVQTSTDQKSLDFLEQEKGIKHERQKEIVEAQAKAQNAGKIASEILKGHNAIEVAKERNNGMSQKANSNKRPKYHPRIDKETGRTFMNIPRPKRSLLPYKMEETGNIAIPTV